MIARSSVQSRDAAFDAIKGVLVILMVVYHVLSITTTAGVEAFRYIRFISGSFIFISGFVVIRFIWDRFQASPRDTSLLLVVRSIKVLLIFTVLNLSIHASGFGNVAKEQLGIAGYLQNAAAIYLVGDGRLSSFLILLPIAYLLLLSPLYFAVSSRSSALVPVGVLLAALAAGSGLDLAPVAEFLLVGVCGLCLGTPALAERLVGTGRPARLSTALGLPLAVWLGGRYGSPLALYCIGVALVLKFMLDAARLASASSWWFRKMALIGQYSLMAYISQIVVIQLLARGIGGDRSAPGATTLALVVGVAAACLLMCLAMAWLRSRSPVVDRAYRLVFA